MGVCRSSDAPNVEERDSTMPYRILVIDDNEDILDMFQELLSVEGYEVIVSDFIDSSAICQIQPDLLILDYLAGQQPVGGQLIQCLKQQPATKDIPVIVCTTAGLGKAEQEPAFSLEGVSVVPKPFDVLDLLHTIRHMLAECRVRAAS
jgi:CheY-like chemotaxis protein